MSLFQEELANSQHGFPEVLDDETTTSGVLEISSSRSLPSSVKVTAAVAIDDTSSTDTIKLSEVANHTSCPSGFFKTSEIYVIKDENDEDDEIESIANTSEIEACKTSDAKLNGVIVTASGGTIYLETPVVEEQQQLNLPGQVEFIEKAGKPKRLSDEFLLAENKETVDYNESTSHVVLKPSSSTVAAINFEMHNELASQIKSKPFVSETQHEKMSVRLKEMNINNSTVHSINICNTNVKNEVKSCDSKPSSSQNHIRPLTDIESMDLIERSDFETEQRLTGGIISKSSSLMSRDMLNLSLIKSCGKLQNQHKKHSAPEQKADNCLGSCNNGRTVSSDTKCTYKELSTTPTSSRNYNSRLTKSTAKLNLCSSLSRSEDQQQQQMETNIGTTTIPLTCSSSSTSIVTDAPSTSSNMCNIENGNAIVAEIFSNFNSNDSIVDATNSTATICEEKQNQSQTSQRHLSSASTINNSGCSRINAIQPGETSTESGSTVFDDTQPSTSSARCQYAPPPKNLRQVNASAQTSERYLTLVTLGTAIATAATTGKTVPSSNSGGINLSLVNRSRRRADATTNLNRNSTSEEVIAAFKVAVAEAAAADAAERAEFHEDPWADCDENNSDMEEICTCHRSISNSSHGGSNQSLNDADELDVSVFCGKEGDLSNYIKMVSISEETSAGVSAFNVQQRKRKYNESRLIDGDSSTAVSNTGLCCDPYSRKRIAYDYSSTPRSSQNGGSLLLVSTPSAQLTLTTTNSPLGRRTPRSIIPTRDNPPPELQNWLSQFQRWSHAERILAVDRLIEHCEPTQVRHMMKVIEPQFQRDFISLLPRELALQVLAYLAPKDLLRAAQTCRSWRFLCDDNLLWKEKCRKAQILTEPRTDRPKRGRAGNMPPIASPWKAAFMRQHIIEMNWRSRPIRDPKVLKGHDDHVITCLQFSGNRIVSGSDDNTLKVWSAVTGRCLRTLVGHTGGVWSSQMAGSIIISGSTDRTLKVWDMETGQCVHTLLGHTSTVRCMHLHGNKVVSGSRDATLRVWDIEQGTCLHVLVGHLAAVRCVQYDGKLIVSGAYDYMVKIWHPERQECLHTLQGHTNRVYSLQFDGLHVVSGSLDTSIRVWDVESGNCKHTLMGHQSLTSGMELRQNILVSGNADSTVKVWDITTGQCLQTLSGPNKHQSAVTCLQFNSRFVVTSSDDGTVKLWDVKTGEFIRNLVALDSGGSGGVVWRIRANDTKLICAVGSRNGTEETKLMVLDFDVEGACVKCS